MNEALSTIMVPDFPPDKRKIITEEETGSTAELINELAKPETRKELVTFIMGYGRMPETEADELAQIVLERAIRHRASWRKESSVQPWLDAIAKHAIIDRGRNISRKIKKEIPFTENTSDGTVANSGQAAGPLTPEQELIQGGDTARHNDRLQILERGIQMLDPEYRTVIELHLQGKKIREIADILDVPLSTVGSRLHRARKELSKTKGLKNTPI